MANSAVDDWIDAPAPKAAAVHGADDWQDVPAAKPEQSLGAAAGEFAHQMNPVSIAKGIWQTVRHPIDTAKAYLDAKQQMIADAEESLSKGDWPGFVRHMQTAALPLPGVDVAVEQASNKWDAGDKAGALGDAAALVSQLAIAPRLPGALKAAGRGIAAAAPDVAAGAAKVAGGEVLAKLPGMEFPARIAMGYPGARQIARGLGKGTAAAFGGEAAEAPAEVGAATAAGPTVETAAKTPGQILAESDGKNWAKVGKAEKQVYEQVAQFKPKFEANAAAEQATATQQAVPRGTTPQPAAEAPPESPTQSAPTVSAQPAPAASTSPEASTPVPEVPKPQTPAEIAIAKNAKAKADRFIAAIQRYNIDFPDRQPITAAGIENLGDAEKSILTRQLKNGGYLKNMEEFTDTSFSYIVQGLKDAESGGNLAQQLAESIRQARARRAAAGR